MDTTKHLHVRASSMPLAAACPASQYPEPGEINVRTTDAAARMGTAVHQLLQAVVDGNPADLSDEALRAAARRHGLPDTSIDEMRMLTIFGLQAWKELQPAFPDPITELECRTTDAPEFVITGHMDVLSYDAGNAAAILDWKSGRLESDYYQQMAAYAFLVMTNPRGSLVQEVSATVVWLRERNYQTYTFDRETIGRWFKDIAQRLTEWDGKTYNVGQQCRYCPRNATCPARRQMVTATAAELLDQDSANMPALTPATIIDLHHRAKVLQGRLEAFNDWLRMQIATKGPIRQDDGLTLALNPENRDTIDPLKAWPLISGLLTDEEAAAAMRITKTGLLKGVGNHAPPRGKGKYQVAFMDQLRAAGAVTTETIFKLKESMTTDPEEKTLPEPME